jgi:hypothetical protein
METNIESQLPFLRQSYDPIFELCRARAAGYFVPCSSWTANATWQGIPTRSVYKLPSLLLIVYVYRHDVQLHTALHDYKVRLNVVALCTLNLLRLVTAQISSDSRFKVFHTANLFA